MRSRPFGFAFLAGLALTLGGCLSTPEYRDPLASLTTPVVKEGPYANQTLRVFRHLDEARGQRMGTEATLDSRAVMDRLNEVLRTRFKSVSMGQAAPGERKTDLVMIFDARISIGSMLLDGLRGLADQERRGFVTVTQLAGWLLPRVARDSGGRQNPQYSALEGEGDFVFVLPASR